MALKTYNPITPGQRQLVLVDRSAPVQGEPVKALTEGQEFDRRPQQQRPHHRRAIAAAATSRPIAQIDFKRRKFDVPANGRAARIRSEPHRLHRADQIRGRRAGLHPGAAAACGRRHGRRRRACRRQARQRHAARQHSGRHHRPQYRAEDRQGRPDRALGRHLCADRRPRRRVRDPAAQFGRAAPGARPLHGDHRRGVEPRQHEHLDRQGRAQPLDGAARPRPRRDHEPGRSSARRAHPRRPPSGDAVGQADQGQEDPQEQEHRRSSSC